MPLTYARNNTPLPNFIEGGPATPVLPGSISLTETDSQAFTQATVNITTGFTSGDLLDVKVDGTALSKNFDAAKGQLTLVGQASAADYLKVLATLSFSHGGQAPTSVSKERSIALSLRDTGGSGVTPDSSSPLTVSVTVQGVNSAAPVLDPAAINASMLVKAGAAAPVNGTIPVGAIRVSDLVRTVPGGNVTDLDRDPIGVAIVAATADATVWFTTDNGKTWADVRNQVRINTPIPVEQRTPNGPTTQTVNLLEVSKNYPRGLFADDNTWIYLQPKPGIEGTINEAVTFRAWDRNSTIGVSVRNGVGGLDLSTVVTTTGRSLFSLFDAASNTTRWFEYVSSRNITWDTARAEAVNKSLGSLKGFLATVASQAEVDAVKGKFTGNAWIGASDAATEGDWKWVTGPESGTSFWSGTANGKRVNNAFANWNSGEPNDSNNEDYALLSGGTGT